MCALEHPEKPNKYGKYWCWCFWSVEVEVPNLLRAKGIAVRAWDEALNTQPEKLIWNVMGMMNNCWHSVGMNVSSPDKGEIVVSFQHPTQPGNQPGGWMDRKTKLGSSNGSLPLENTASRQFSVSDVRQHSSRNSTWIVVHGRVYDCTTFLKDHPGGVDSILLNAGSDCTEEFDAVHSDRAKSMLNSYCIGELLNTGHTTDAAMMVSGVTALANPGGKVPVRLIAKTQISHNARLFRLALPFANQSLGLPVGKHVFLRARIGGKLCIRAYTPTSPANAVGYLELLIRIYFKGEHPGFPDGGLMSQHLESLAIGSELEIRGPVGDIEYTGRGNFLVDGKPRFARRLAMVAGGTGITPVYQVIQAVIEDQPEDGTEMHLVYANRSEDDILMREELDGWARVHKDRLKVWYVVSQARRREEWGYSVGLLTEGILREHIPVGGREDTLALVCGPPAMIEMSVVPNLVKLGYDVSNSCLKF
ncbi:hypothetical protein HPP92_010974 [Vanilla planifolia]|uniref:Nitrate reductase n=1 Tax=Vanilla planifolia TaxID=51239 RepID=A0A835V1Y1_VANPL|nr:hypothetical protein HPP92_010974 [Vanilla planifolia]